MVVLIACGNECTKRCGHCLDSRTCDTVSGKCQDGCASGWIGDACKTSLPDTQATTTALAVVAAVAVIASVSLVAGIVVFLWYVRRQRTKRESDQRSTSRGANIDRNISEAAKGQNEDIAEQVNLSNMDTSSSATQGQRPDGQTSRDGQHENDYVNSTSDVQTSEYENLDVSKLTTAEDIYETISGV